MYEMKPLLHEREAKAKRGMLHSLLVDVTNKCNMNCSFCYADTFSNRTPIDLHILEKALNEAYDMGVTHIILMGGEVCADFERLVKVIPMCHPSETYLNIVTNGWGMDKEKIETLIELQVDKITYSLDSGIESEHDASRMKGSYKRVLNSIKIAHELGLQTGISTVVSHSNLHGEGFNKICEITKELGIRLDIQILEPVGKLDAIANDLITKEDSEYILELTKKSPIIEDGRKMIKRDVYRNGECPAGKEFMAITVDGNFMPCNFLQVSLGNIRDKSLTQMREDLLKSKWFSESYPVCLAGECKEYFDEIILPNENKEKPLDAYEVYHLK